MNRAGIKIASIFNILCWLVIGGVLNSRASSNPIYYHYLKGEKYLRLLDFLLLFGIPFYLGLKIQLYDIISLDNIRGYYTVMKIIFSIISLLLLPHFIYWFYIIILDAWYIKTYNIGIILYDIIVGTYLLESFFSLNKLTRKGSIKNNTV